jgi:hypothetical protein
MNKRHLLAAGMLAPLWPVTRATAASSDRRGPGLLTVSGAIGKSNRGPTDSALDQMMLKHGVRFDKAFVFDAGALGRLPAVRIKPTLEYDGKVHALRGPLLVTVLEAAGAATGAAMIGLRAVDGYAVALSLADVRSYRMVVATELDGQALALGGLGPQWALYEADTVPAFKDKPLKERFALCPWALYHIEVQRG